MQIRELDHIVIATPDLDATCAEIARATGVQPAAGGVHPDFGTYNALVGLDADAYLEIVAIDRTNDAVAQHAFGLDGLAQARVATFAIHPDDLDAARQGADDFGVEVGELGEGSRRTNEGDLLTWRLSSPGASGDVTVPFLIDWLGSPSPAQTLSVHLDLDAFSAVHPDPQGRRDLLRAMGTDVSVAEGPESGFELTLTGPLGSWSLPPRA